MEASEEEGAGLEDGEELLEGSDCDGSEASGEEEGEEAGDDEEDVADATEEDAEPIKTAISANNAAAVKKQAPSNATASNLAATVSGRQPDQATRGDLPFTIAAPGSYEDFARLVEGRPASELTLAVQRIRICNAIALNSENRRKLQVCGGL